VRVIGIIIGTSLALALQTTVARFLVGRDVGVDLVLVAVLYASLTSGPVTGILTGTLAGLVQDALSTGTGVGVIGIGSFAKTAVGFVVGLVGTQFIVSQALSRFVVFYAGSVLHAAIFIGLYALLGLRDLSVPYTTILWQGLANALVGVIAIQGVELLPGSVERRRLARTKSRH
jgi:rod shape-determining protein MreD